MALKIRLRRMGRRNAPSYRIVVAESSMPRDGRIIESLGHYNPRTDPLTLSVDRARALHWIERGATPTDTAQALLKRAGVFRPEAEVGVVAAVTAGARTSARKAATAVKAAAAKVGEVVGDAAGEVRDAAGGAVEAVTEAAEDVVEAVKSRRGRGTETEEAAAMEGEAPAMEAEAAPDEAEAAPAEGEAAPAEAHAAPAEAETAAAASAEGETEAETPKE